MREQVTVEVYHDDPPDEVAARFVEALRQLGVQAYDVSNEGQRDHKQRWLLTRYWQGSVITNSDSST